MTRETSRQAYLDNLESILTYTGGVHLLRISAAKEYLGIVDDRTIRKMMPFMPGGKITAESMARALSKEG